LNLALRAAGTDAGRLKALRPDRVGNFETTSGPPVMMPRWSANVTYALGMFDAAARQAHALHVAVSIGKEMDLRCEHAHVIKDSNNTIVHLAPSPVIAKVATTTLRPRTASVMTNELRIARFLAGRGAPIAPPASEVPAGPHARHETVLTLWAYCKHVPHRRVSDLQLASALRSFHAAFAAYPDPLPSFIENLDRARDALSRSSATPRLRDDDRTFLVDAGACIASSLAKFDLASLPLHGDPHLDGNILITDNGPLFVDFEAACAGPYEWDLTSLVRARLAYPDTRDDVLRILSKMRSLCVATWCWMQYGRAPEVTEAAHVHLSLLRDGAYN
jgi:hypothetical protein